MPVTLNDAMRMLREDEECPFTYGHVSNCRKNPELVLFTWQGVDFFLVPNL